MSEESAAGGDGDADPEDAIQGALMEVHHLANLTGTDEAELARQRLVSAQSASRPSRTLDLLGEAQEYLQLARLQRRDTAAGFAEAEAYVVDAAAALREEAPPVQGSVAEVVSGPSDHARRRSLLDMRDEAAVDSFDDLRSEVVVDELFRAVRRSVRAETAEREGDEDGGDDANDGGDAAEDTDEGAADPAAPATDADREERDVTAAEALRLATAELAVKRTTGDAGDSEFQFLTPDQLVEVEE